MLHIDEPDDKKWTGLQWAVINGHTECVKILLEKENENKTKHSLNESVAKVKHDDMPKDHNKTEFDDVFKKPLNPADNGKYNPLHWAAYKGNVIISSILLKHENLYDPLETDNYGNNALHQAAASNKLELFKLFMGRGIDLEIKNSRSHMAYDLTSNKAIQQLILKTLAVKTCQLCPKQFDFFSKRYLCSIKEEVVCKNCCIRDYYYEHPNSNDKDMYDCRCKTCHQEITKAEEDLRNAITSNNLSNLTETFALAKNFKICQLLIEEAKINLDRLSREKQILEHLNNLKTVENHKSIEKSVFQLEEMVRVAKQHNIELDFSIIEKAYLEKNRLLAEKELRKILSNLTVAETNKDTLENLNEKIDNAKKCSVDEGYIVHGVDLSEKMQLNLKSRDLLDLFLAYPIREYPKIEPVDPKKRGAISIIINFNK
jgi:ankyrin repeat protein